MVPLGWGIFRGTSNANVSSLHNLSKMLQELLIFTPFLFERFLRTFCPFYFFRFLRAVNLQRGTSVAFYSLIFERTPRRSSRSFSALYRQNEPSNQKSCDASLSIRLFRIERLYSKPRYSETYGYTKQQSAVPNVKACVLFSPDIVNTLIS